MADVRGGLRANVGTPTSSRANKSKQVREATVGDFFEDNCGNAHLQALEMLATESNVKVKSFGQDVLRKSDKLFKDLDKHFDLDDLLEDVLENEDSILSTEDGFQKAVDLLAQMGITNTTQLVKMRDYVTSKVEKLGSLNREFVEKIKALKQMDEYSDAIKNQIKDLRIDSMSTLAAISEKACEQILRMCEIFIMSIAEEKLENDDATKASRAVEYATHVRELSLIMLTEVQFLSITMAATVNELLSTWKDVVDSNDKLEDSRKDAIEVVDKSAKEILPQIDADTGTCMTFVQEAVGSIQPILKLMIISSASK